MFQTCGFPICIGGDPLCFFHPTSSTSSVPHIVCYVLRSSVLHPRRRRWSRLICDLEAQGKHNITISPWICRDHPLVPQIIVDAAACGIPPATKPIVEIMSQIALLRAEIMILTTLEGDVVDALIRNIATRRSIVPLDDQNEPVASVVEQLEVYCSYTCFLNSTHVLFRNVSMRSKTNSTLLRPASTRPRSEAPCGASGSHPPRLLRRSRRSERPRRQALRMLLRSSISLTMMSNSVQRKNGLFSDPYFVFSCTNTRLYRSNKYMLSFTYVSHCLVCVDSITSFVIIEQMYSS